MQDAIFHRAWHHLNNSQVRLTTAAFEIKSDPDTSIRHHLAEALEEAKLAANTIRELLADPSIS